MFLGTVPALVGAYGTVVSYNKTCSHGTAAVAVLSCFGRLRDYPCKTSPKSFVTTSTLDDPKEEAIHRRFQAGCYRESANAQAAGDVHRRHNIPSEEKGVASQAPHFDNSPGSL